MYTYPQALDAMEKVATDLFAQAKFKGVFPKDKDVTVRVVADADTGTASVNWEDYSSYLAVTIYMPVLPATYRMTASEFEHWAAYLYHEIGHPLHTNQLVWQKAVCDGKHKLLNSLEDVREEKASNDSGIAVNGKQVLTDLIESLSVKAWANGYDPNNPKSIGWTLSYLGRAVCNGYALDHHAVTSKLDPHGPVAKVVSWAVPALGACTSTQDCLDLSEKVLAALPKNPPKSKEGEQGEQGEQADGEQAESEQGEQAESEQGEQAESEQGEQGEQGEPEQGEDATSEPKQGEQAESEPKQGEQAENEQAGKAGTGKGGPASEQEPEPLTDVDLEEISLAPKSKEAMQSSSKAIREAMVIQAVRDAAKTVNRKPKPVADGYEFDTQFLAAAAAKATKQRALLARALKAHDMDDYEGGRNRGRLDRKAFARKAAGSLAIFGKRIVTEGYETDVAVLIDGSSSMAGREIQVALELALVIAQAANQVGVACEAYLFNGGSYLHEITAGKKRPVAARFAGAKQHVNGGTPLCASLLKTAMRQTARARGKRKVLFAITDGACNHGIASMIATVAYIEKAMGIEVANLMIGTPVTGAFRNEVSVQASKNVCEVGLEQLTRQLERGVS